MYCRSDAFPFAIALPSLFTPFSSSSLLQSNAFVHNYIMVLRIDYVACGGTTSWPNFSQIGDVVWSWCFPFNGAAPSFRRSDDSEQLLSVGGGVISLPSFPRKEQLFRSLNGFTIISSTSNCVQGCLGRLKVSMKLEM